MHPNNRHYILIIFALVATVASIVGYFFLHSAIISQAGRSGEISTQISVIEAKEKNDQFLATTYGTLPDNSSDVNKSIVSQNKIVDFIEFLESMRLSAGVELQISDIRVEGAIPDDGKTALGLGHFQVHVEAKGSWTNIMKVLVLLENIPYSATLNNIKLAKSSDSAKSSVWDLALDMRVLTTK